MTASGMPSHIAANEDAAAAWTHGRSDADRAHAHSEANREPFETDGTKVGVPSIYTDGGDLLREAYADGYSVRAQDLTDAGDCADIVDGYETGDCPTCDERAGRSEVK